MAAGELLATSGQIGIADRPLVEGGMPAQFVQALSNLKDVLESAGA